MGEIVGQTLKGQTKSILVEEDAVTISYRPCPPLRQPDKRIPYTTITAVQFHEPGSSLAGYIQFSIHGTREWHGKVSQDQYALQFDKADAASFQALRDHVQTKIARGGSPASSLAGELGKLAILREHGVLTDDEFAALKAKLLA